MPLKKTIIIGSTGSIGKNAVQIAKRLKNIHVIGLAANRNFKLLAEQADELNCRQIALFDERQYGSLAKIAKNKKIFTGVDGVSELIDSSKPDIILFASSGTSGLIPFIHALKSKAKIALANKEIIVLAGEYINRLFEKNKTLIIPVDSEHSAIFQCLQGHNKNEASRIILTASGGPFRNSNFAKIAKASPKSALLHPVWSMGAKISIDSATLMNKALEIIEAKWLFDLQPKQIQVLIHPQSVIHSMVEFIDGSILAQMSEPDMRLPIQYAFTYPERKHGMLKPFSFAKFPKLEFYLPDRKRFPSLDFAYFALQKGGTMPVVMNAANDVAVEKFINGKIRIPDIWTIIEKTMSRHNCIKNPSLDEILSADNEARIYAENITQSFYEKR